jgi:chromosome segregation ATPase
LPARLPTCAPFFVIPTGCEDLREKREEINRQISKEEEEKNKIQRDISILTDRLAKINESLARKSAARNDYDITIKETEAAYMKVRWRAHRAAALHGSGSGRAPPPCRCLPLLPRTG